jgi:hypothetical protein
MFRVFVPVVKAAAKAMSLLQKYISKYFDSVGETREEDGDVMLAEAYPMGER